jgi:hypothetical protein
MEAIRLPSLSLSLSLSALHAANMPGIEFSSNENPPESEVDQNIDWDSIAEFDGPAHDLDYAMVWDEGTQCYFVLVLFFLLQIFILHLY